MLFFPESCVGLSFLQFVISTILLHNEFLCHHKHFNNWYSDGATTFQWEESERCFAQTAQQVLESSHRGPKDVLNTYLENNSICNVSFSYHSLTSHGLYFCFYHWSIIRKGFSTERRYRISQGYCCNHCISYYTT